MILSIRYKLLFEHYILRYINYKILGYFVLNNTETFPFAFDCQANSWLKKVPSSRIYAKLLEILNKEESKWRLISKLPMEKLP